MAQEVTLGGDRLGSGNKQKVELHNYQMSSFNLEQDWKSSMAPGVLYPFLKLVGTTHDSFDIDLDSFIRTLPTKGPLFGSFKFQADIFACPIRLYQGILHNNPVGIGLKMNQVYLPKLEISTIDGNGAPIVPGSDKYNRQVNESALMKYLGFSGIGYAADAQYNASKITRKVNAIPALAYYDIFKCYYSNKQEENAYVLTPGTVTEVTGTITAIYNEKIDAGTRQVTDDTVNTNFLMPTGNLLKIEGTEMAVESIELTDSTGDVFDQTNLEQAIEDGFFTLIIEREDYVLLQTTRKLWQYMDDAGDDSYITFSRTAQKYTTSDITLTPFALSNIDEMRNRLLSSNTLGDEYVIDNGYDLLPYSTLTEETETGISYNAFIDNGLVVKTYQSDLFNNWLDTEYIDGANGISALSAVTIVDGKFTMDSLNLAEKIYEMLNRVAVAGGTYEDWQEAVYGEGAVRKAETPMYMGGMSAEVMFEEVISNADVDSAIKKDQPLGSLAGKGTQVGKKGGNNIHIKCEEPCYILGICSLTPRICYSQGNDWDITELDTLDDLHKPAMDGIGFQDLLAEQFAWFANSWQPGGSIPIQRPSAGKQIAWINYQTAVDKCYGDFGRSGGYAFMCLNRNYEMNRPYGGVKDITTYIDPSKYNYAFAVQNLASQNFWVQIHSKVVARRKMAAQQIPNL